MELIHQSVLTIGHPSTSCSMRRHEGECKHALHPHIMSGDANRSLSAPLQAQMWGTTDARVVIAAVPHPLSARGLGGAMKTPPPGIETTILQWICQGGQVWNHLTRSSKARQLLHWRKWGRGDLEHFFFKPIRLLMVRKTSITRRRFCNVPGSVMYLRGWNTCPHQASSLGCRGRNEMS